MAVYKGREVELLGKTDGSDTSPLYTILQKDGSRENVPLNQIQLTEDEKKQATDNSVQHLEGARVIEDKKLQELRDSQDKQKIEENQKNQSTEPVEVSKVLVDPSEVNDKSRITPQTTVRSKK